MAALALRTSAFANAVSRLHGEVSRRILAPYYPGVPEHEVPVGHVTNGAHTRSCVSREMPALRPLPRTRLVPPARADRDLERCRRDSRRGAVGHPRAPPRAARGLRPPPARAPDRAPRRLGVRGRAARGVLNTRALTIGFARRFATYKRANLILHDLDRLKRILLSAERPCR